MGASPTPNSITTIGIQDSGEIMRSSWKAPPVACSTARDRPISKPSGTPITRASTSPTSTRCRLASTCAHSCPLPSNQPRLLKVGQGASRLAIGMVCCSSQAPICHRSRSTSKPSAARAAEGKLSARKEADAWERPVPDALVNESDAADASATPVRSTYTGAPPSPEIAVSRPASCVNGGDERGKVVLVMD